MKSKPKKPDEDILYKLTPPCEICRQVDRSSFTCLKCEARSAYASACIGDADAIEYIKSLDYSKLGIDSSTPSKEWERARIRHQKLYEMKYAKKIAEKLFELSINPPDSDSDSNLKIPENFRELILYLYEVNITRAATAIDLGISDNTLTKLFKTFAIPVRKKSETLALIEKAKAKLKKGA